MATCSGQDCDRPLRSDNSTGYCQTCRRHGPLDKATQRAYRLRSKYGLTVEDWETLLDIVGRKCELCGHNDPSHLCVDHDHVNGRFRGVLCRFCNSAIGALGDTPAALYRAAEYLNERTQR